MPFFSLSQATSVGGKTHRYIKNSINMLHCFYVIAKNPFASFWNSLSIGCYMLIAYEI